MAAMIGSLQRWRVATHVPSRCTLLLAVPAIKRQPGLVEGSRRCIVRSAPLTVLGEAQVSGMTKFLDSLKYDRDGLVAVVAQVRTCHLHL